MTAETISTGPDNVVELQPNTTEEPKAKEPTKGKRKSKKLEQTELNAMPERDGVGKAGKRFKDAVEELDRAMAEKGEAMDALIRALKSAKRTSIQVEGYHFQYKHNGPSDRILTKKPK